MEFIASSSLLEQNGGRIEIRHAHFPPLQFVATVYKKDVFDRNKVFEQLNLYIQRELTPVQQNALFQTYNKISKTLLDASNIKVLTDDLKVLCEELVSYFDFEKCRTWLWKHSGLTFPDIAQNYVADTDRDYTPEKTYIFNEYIDLLTMAFLMRLFIPVWVYYVRMIKDRVGTGLKEHSAFKLLERTHLYQNRSVYKMISYIRENNKNEVIRSGALGLMNPDDVPYWIMTQFCVRKLAIVELQFPEPRSTLVSLLYNFIKACNNEGNFQDRYKDKTPKDGGTVSEGDGGDNKISVYERHRNTTDLSIEEAAELENCLPKDIFKAAKQLCPKVPKDLLKESIESAKILLTPDFITLTALPCQKTVLGWILSPLMSIKGIAYQYPATIVKYQALAEALLWHHDLRFLALWISSRTPLDEGDYQLTTSAIRSKITEENSSYIRQLYPHVRVNPQNKEDKEDCFILKAIDEISEEISNHTWITTAASSKLIEYQGVDSGRLNIHSEIRNELASLIIKIANGQLYLS